VADQGTVIPDDERRPSDDRNAHGLSRRRESQWYGWSWGDRERRSGLPWIGIFLVGFGALLLLERAVPQLRVLSSAIVLAVGLVLLLRWAAERRIAFLYGGAIITALAIPGTLQGVGLPSPEGLGTLCLGIAFLFIALVRWQSGSGVGWQAWLGAILTVLGGARVALPQLDDLFLPALLVALGALLVFRSRDRG
jgi:hypothetical protein